MPAGTDDPPVSKIIAFETAHAGAFGAVDAVGDVEGGGATDFVGDEEQIDHVKS